MNFKKCVKEKHFKTAKQVITKVNLNKGKIVILETVELHVQIEGVQEAIAKIVNSTNCFRSNPKVQCDVHMCLSQIRIHKADSIIINKSGEKKNKSS